MIQATLLCDESRPNSNLSFFGTKRTIREAELTIIAGEKDFLALGGGPQFTAEVDFENETFDDSLVLYLKVTEEKFLNMRESLARGTLSAVDLSIAYVNGFYAPWVPEASTPIIKILSKHHGLDIPSDCDVDLTTLGEVGEFTLKVINHTDLRTSWEEPDENDMAEQIVEIEEDFEQQLSTGEDLQLQTRNELVKFHYSMKGELRKFMAGVFVLMLVGLIAMTN